MSKEQKKTNRKEGNQFKKGEKSQHSIYKHSWLHRLIHRGDHYHIEGLQSKSFHRKPYEMPIETLSHVTRDSIGFTNSILLRKDTAKKTAQLFVPAYTALKVKSIKQIQIKDLIAQLNCVLIIIFLIEGLPDELVRLLESQVMIQVNKGQSFKLFGGDDSTKIKKIKMENRFLKFIVRDVIPVEIHDDVFLSPFQILNLVLTITINSISVPKQATIYQGFKTQISFNNMRNPEKMSVSFVSSDSRLGVYELAEKIMAHYPSNLATYNEVKDQLSDFINGKKVEVPEKVKEDHSKCNIASHTRRPDERLQLVLHQSSKQLPQKIKYFEYSHFVVPLYKGPGNAWATIFIPIMMLAFLSLSLFFYKATPTEKIGTVATIVLGFIALIPSIKDQLPPCNKTTLSQIIVYIQSINCMLSLTDNTINFRRSNWILDNKLFLFSLMIHFLCIGLAFLLMILHKFFWQPSYNTKEKAKQLSPIDDKISWSNPYCDEYFLEYNKNHSIKVEKYCP